MFPHEHTRKFSSLVGTFNEMIVTSGLSFLWKAQKNDGFAVLLNDAGGGGVSGGGGQAHDFVWRAGGRG